MHKEYGESVYIPLEEMKKARKDHIEEMIVHHAKLALMQIKKDMDKVIKETRDA